MSSALAQAALYGGLGASAGVAGGALGVIGRPGDALQSAVQHFAAGVVLAGAALELLPEATAIGDAGAILGGFAAGGMGMAGLKALTSRLERRDVPGSSGLLVATGADVLVDGLVVGASFAAGGTTGTLIAIALSIELFFLCLASGREVGGGTGRALVVTASIALMLAVGAVIGAAAFSGAGPEVLAAALAFAAAVLIYLPTEELLGEAHALSDTAVGTLALFAGFGAFLAIDLAA